MYLEDPLPPSGAWDPYRCLAPHLHGWARSPGGHRRMTGEPRRSPRAALSRRACTRRSPSLGASTGRRGRTCALGYAIETKRARIIDAAAPPWPAGLFVKSPLCEQSGIDGRGYALGEAMPPITRQPLRSEQSYRRWVELGFGPERCGALIGRTASRLDAAKPGLSWIAG